MRIDISQILGQGGIKVNAGVGPAADSLREGDIIRAVVISNDRNSAMLRTETGLILRAKPDADVALLPGDEVRLEFAGKDKGLLLISVSRDEAAINELSGRPGTSGGPADKSLEPYLNKLTELNMPASRETAQVMRELVAQNPGLSLDQAAFLAANKLTGNEALMRAALALLASGEKTDAIVARLQALLDRPEASGNPSPGIRNPEYQIAGRISVSPEQAAQGNQAAAASAKPSPLTELFTLLGRIGAEASDASMRGGLTAEPRPQSIISQNDIAMQSKNVENMKEIMQNGANKVEQQPVDLKNPTSTPSQNALSGANSEFRIPNSAFPASPPSQNSQPSSHISQLAVEPQNSQNALSGANSEFRIPNSAFLASLLSELPEFRGTPTPVLERFSDMLLRIAGENAATYGSDSEKLAAVIDKLFTKIGRNDADAGARLKIAREELMTRLALIEEVNSRASHPAKMDMHNQTQRLAEHVRLLNSIEQFGYMQLPVQLREERKTAELYIFKKKGGRRPDPDNVNILLAIDLEYMGRWEALLNIRGKDISVQMEVKGPAEKDHFSENTVLLHEMLAESGFKLVGTSITYSETKTTPLTALSSLERFTTGRAGAIDFKI